MGNLHRYGCHYKTQLNLHTTSSLCLLILLHGLIPLSDKMHDMINERYSNSILKLYVN